MPGNNRNRINNLIEPDSNLGKIKDRSELIVELTAFMGEIRHDLSVKKEHDILKFVRLLVGEKYANKSPYKEKSGPLFYKNYSTAVFEEYSPDEEARNLFLAVNGLSPEYAKLSLAKRIDRIAAQYNYSQRTAYNHLESYVLNLGLPTIVSMACTATSIPSAFKSSSFPVICSFFAIRSLSNLTAFRSSLIANPR